LTGIQIQVYNDQLVVSLTAVGGVIRRLAAGLLMTARYLWALLLLLAAASVAQDVPARIRELQPRTLVSDDQAVNPSSFKSRPALPARARAEGARARVERANAGWESARWTRAVLQLPGTAQKTIAVSAPSTLLIRASWTSQSDLAVTVVKGTSTLATARLAKRFDGERIATAQVRVPSAGDIVIRATGSGSQPVKVDLFVGVLAAAH
jgi:hypothetical protein